MSAKNKSEPLSDDDVLAELSKLAKELEVIKTSVNRLEQSRMSSNLPQIETESIIDMIKEKNEESSKQILHEMKSEFFRLINFLTNPADNQAQDHMLQRIRQELNDIEIGATTPDKKNIADVESNAKISGLMDMLQERENLIYELSDQIVTLSIEKKQIEEKLSSIETEHEKWSVTKDVITKLISTDPRYSIINMLRQLHTISQMQLSFILGISLSQTKKYISDLEEISIVLVKEDGSVELNPAFDTTLL